MFARDELVIMSTSQKRFNEIIDEISSESCKKSYCFFRKFVESLHPDPRVLIQLKCIEMFKWEESEREDHDIDWNEAGMRWSLEGYAEAFAKVFNEELSVRKIYMLTLAETKKNHP